MFWYMYGLRALYCRLHMHLYQNYGYPVSDPSRHWYVHVQMTNLHVHVYMINQDKYVYICEVRAYIYVVFVQQKLCCTMYVGCGSKFIWCRDLEEPDLFVVLMTLNSSGVTATTCQSWCMLWPCGQRSLYGRLTVNVDIIWCERDFSYIPKCLCNLCSAIYQAMKSLRFYLSSNLHWVIGLSTRLKR